MAHPIDEDGRAKRLQRGAILRARRARLAAVLTEMEADLRHRMGEPDVQQALADARHHLEQFDAAIARVESLCDQ